MSDNTKTLIRDVEFISSDDKERFFGDIVTKYQNSLQRAAFNLIYCEEEAKDIVQDTFFSFFNNLDKFRGESSLFTYLYRIVLNKSIDYLRKFKKISKSVELDENLEAKSELDDIDTKIVVNKALKNLDIKHSLVLILLEYENKSYEDIGKILDISLDNVKITIFRARKKLHKILLKMGVTDANM